MPPVSKKNTQLRIPEWKPSPWMQICSIATLTWHMYMINKIYGLLAEPASGHK